VEEPPDLRHPRSTDYRRVTLANDLARHRTFAARPRLRVAVSGASGLIGTALGAFLSTGGHEVLKLVRRAPAAANEIAWDPANDRVDAERLEGLDALVHLAGENIGAGRWTERRKRALADSRVLSTALLARTLASLGHKPRVWLSASGVAYYGAAPSGPCPESAPSGDDFLSELARAWEAATRPAEEAGIRVVIPRLAAALTPAGGALAKLLTPFRLGVGGPVGRGTQPFSWIALDDVLYAMYHLLYDDALRGPVNLASPGRVDNRGLARTLGRVLGRPSFWPVPGWLVSALFGEMGRVLLLGGQEVVPAALQRAGFTFSHPGLEPALRHLLGRS
jgi:uncharacterized protein (TIGR01777 family)